MPPAPRTEEDGAEGMTPVAPAKRTTPTRARDAIPQLQFDRYGADIVTAKKEAASESAVTEWSPYE